MNRLLRRVLLGLAILVVVAQAIPYGHNHDSPPVRKEPAWSSPRVRELAKGACFDCHSNETVWPWYSHVAPISWLLQRDVEQGRKHLNFSEFDRPQRNAHEAAEEVESGEMPPWFYKPTHSAARLSDAEKAELIAGLRATFGGDDRPHRGGREKDD